MSTIQRAELSKVQMEIYLECIAFPERTTYNLPFLYKLQKDADIDRLKNALEKLIAAHPALGTKIVTGEDGTALMEQGAFAGVREYSASDADFILKKE